MPTHGIQKKRPRYAANMKKKSRTKICTHGPALQLDRFWAKVEKTDYCWNWIGAKDSDGYGCFSLNKKTLSSHRISYELHVGKIPTDLEIDHLCRNRSCCNPSHLEVVTHKENTLRGMTITAAYTKRTHCKNGHEYTKENISRSAKNYRRCKKCANQNSTKYYTRHPEYWIRWRKKRKKIAQNNS